MHVICFCICICLWFSLKINKLQNKQKTKTTKVNCQNDIEVNYIRMHFEIKLSGPKNGTVVVNDILLVT